ncbi:Zinc finger domain-containing protein 1 [Collichthys lucidus]|uniref:Zinc finger domain-containing protein 1 n=1 Tax=Collichthys lucidus TaxID=240159 RepID=A0A4U5V161_COLLU|nr:Zinc finger domain-containing protein 1 [Collichthys lucidus]
MERRHLTDHESDECVERLQSCQYCELELPLKELDEHHVACGSRTELCRECGRYITLRDQPGHGLTCSATEDGSGPSQTTSKPPAHNIKATRSDDVEDKPEEEEGEDEDYLSEQGGALWINSAYKSNSMSYRASNGSWDEGGDPDQISTCPYCHLALPLRTLRWHKGKCRIHVIMK